MRDTINWGIFKRHFWGELLRHQHELVEQSSLSIRRTLAPIGIPRSTFYDWYSRYQEGGIEALEDGKPRPMANSFGVVQAIELRSRRENSARSTR